jgi:hypothetical protein
LPHPVEEKIKGGRVIDTGTDGFSELTEVVMMNAVPSIHFINPRGLTRNKVDYTNSECRSQKNEKNAYGSIDIHDLVNFPISKP